MPLFDPDDPRTLRPWLLEHLCPFWRERIVDPAGGFFETSMRTGGRSTISGARRSCKRA